MKSLLTLVVLVFSGVVLCYAEGEASLCLSQGEVSSLHYFGEEKRILDECMRILDQKIEEGDRNAIFWAAIEAKVVLYVLQREKSALIVYGRVLKDEFTRRASLEEIPEKESEQLKNAFVQIDEIAQVSLEEIRQKIEATLKEYKPPPSKKKRK